MSAQKSRAELSVWIETSSIERSKHKCASIILCSPPLARQVTWLLRPTSCQCFTLWKEKCYLQTPQSPPHHHYYCLPKHQTWTCTPWDCSVCLLCEVTLYNILILLRIETGTLNLWMATDCSSFYNGRNHSHSVRMRCLQFLMSWYNQYLMDMWYPSWTIHMWGCHTPTTVMQLT